MTLDGTCEAVINISIELGMKFKIFSFNIYRLMCIMGILLSGFNSSSLYMLSTSRFNLELDQVSRHLPKINLIFVPVCGFLEIGLSVNPQNKVLDFL